MKNTLFAFLLLFFTSLSAQTIIQQESQIDFKVASIFGVKVKGEIPNIKGEIIFNKANLNQSKFDVHVLVDGLNTGNQKRDSHLKNEDFFDANKYTKITFVSDKIYFKDGNYFTSGKLTIKDVTKSIVIPFKTSEIDEKTVLTGGFAIDRFDYNIGVNESKMFVDKDIAISITCTLKK